MVPLRVLTLVVVGQNQPSVLVLEPVEETLPGKSRVVPIWIGDNEATQLSLAINHVKLPRPTTHDLFLDAITNLDARVDHVLINKIEGKLFHAQLFIKQGDRIIKLDSRPTDAIALALRQEAPLYITQEARERASFPYLFKTSRSQEEELESFKLFLEELAPDDFAGQ